MAQAAANVRGVVRRILIGYLAGVGLWTWLALSCYAHVSTPSCAQDSSQQGCYPPLHDERGDAGR